jgi:hypothetical protein
MDDRIVVHDSFSSLAPRMITMEPWHEVVYMAADGVHTVGQFIEQMGMQYEGRPPAGLAEQIRDIVGTLIDQGILRTHEQPESLPPYLAEEYFKQPPEVRKAQMETDGRIGKSPPDVPNK